MPSLWEERLLELLQAKGPLTTQEIKRLYEKTPRKDFLDMGLTLGSLVYWGKVRRVRRSPTSSLYIINLKESK